MNHLLREIAPVSTRAWEAIDEEARDQLVPALGARRLVDFFGPYGWQHSATNLGRIRGLDGASAAGVAVAERRVLPVIELRAAFTVARAELADIDRGAADPDFDDLDEAAGRIALAENAAVFTGVAKAGVVGIVEASPHPAIPLGKEPTGYPSQIARAAEALLRNGIDGPYAVALSPDEHTRVVESTEHGGYPVFDHVRRILGGPIVRVPGLTGAVVLSLRGGDFLLECGQDLSVGYDRSDEARVHLYLEESFSFRVATPEAAVVLPAGNARPRK